MSERNQYDCTDCPKCGSEHRHPGTVGDVAKGIFVTNCDDCGHKESWDGWLHELYEMEE